MYGPLLVLFTRCKTPPFYMGRCWFCSPDVKTPPFYMGRFVDLTIQCYALKRKGEPRMKYKKPRPESATESSNLPPISL
ncbi:hypothetical protein OIU78_010795 [Salix suchowensis]|nr:hypothetical protein OIU78_010795 [Salix suchowensis]